MKMKSFAMLALSGLLAASCAYVAPAMADDTNMAAPSMQPPADSTPNSNIMQGLSQNDSTYNTPADTTDNASDNTGTDQSNPNAQNNPNNNPSANPSDEGGPDTATGDDDY